MQNPLNSLLPLIGMESPARMTSNLARFCRQAWKTIEPQPLVWSWHHDVIAEYLQLVYERKCKRLIITVPPRMTKSKIASVMFPAWCWARNPSLSFICTSYSDQLSTEFSIARRNLLSSDWFQRTWPGRVQFAADQNQKTVFQNQAFGVMRATSMTGAAAGVGADILIVDDPLALQSAYSDVDRMSVNRDFDGAFRSRLNDPENGAIVIICQRLHQQDLVGHLLENEPGVWTLLSLPMVSEQDEIITFPVSGREILRLQGDLLQPARFGPATVESERRVNAFRWTSQYQQRPAPLGGAIFKGEWLRRYDSPPTHGTKILALDTAFSTKKTAHYSAASVWIANEDGFHLAFVWRDKVEYPQLKMTVENLAAFWRVESVVIEEAASGRSLIQSLRQETNLPIAGFKVESDKVSRAYGVQALFESGRVLVPRQAGWLPDFLSELELFPFSRNDDMVDTCTMGLAYLRDQLYEHTYPLLDMVKPDAAGEPSRWQKLMDRCAAALGFETKDALSGKVILDPRGDNIFASKMYKYEAAAAGTTVEQLVKNMAGGPEVWNEAAPPACPLCKSISVRIGGGGNRCSQCGHQFHEKGKEPYGLFMGRGGPISRRLP